jgi:hypothetical protein
MAEIFPSDAKLNALSGTADAEQAVPYIPIGLSPYHTEFYKMLYRLLDVSRRAGDLRVYKDDSGELKFGVRPGKFLHGDTAVDYTGATGQSLTDNTVNAIYLTTAGVLTVNTSGFPTPSVTPHIPLATIATGTASAAGVSGQYAHQDITDYRGRAIFQIPGASGAGDWLSRTLSSGHLFVGNASDVATDVALSGEATLNASGAMTIANGAITDAKINANASIARGKLAINSLTPYSLPLLLTCNRSGVPVGTAYPGQDPTPGQFSLALGMWDTGGCYLASNDATEGNGNTYLRFEFPLPPEYVASGAIRLVIRAHAEADPLPPTKTIAVQVRKCGDGLGGTDLCQTSAQNLTGSDTDYTFILNGSGLAAGDRIDVLVRTLMSGGDNTGNTFIRFIKMLLDIQG